MSAKTKNELETLLPEKTVTLDGRTLEIRPPHFSELGRVVGALAKMGKAFYDFLTHDGIKFRQNGSPVVNDAFLSSLQPLCDGHTDDLIELMSCYTGKPIEYFADPQYGFTIEEGIYLISEIIRRNYDFFMKRLAPVWKEIMEQISKK